jgi:phage gpG-like protein
MSVATVKFDRTKIVNAMRQVAAVAINEGAARMQTGIKEGLNRTGGFQSKPGGWPGRRSGELGRKTKLTPAKKTDLRARVGTNVPQGAYMQFGVKASRGKGLTVPVNAKASRGLQAHGGIRGLAKAEGLVYIKSSRNPKHVGVWVKVAKGKAKKKKVEVWVVLRKSVAARPWASLGLKEFRAASIKAAQDAFARDWAVVKQRIAVKYGGAKP